jgi:hypothetical protein
VAPPKRKTGGRVTAAGTRPTDKRKTTGSAATADHEDGATQHHYESGRYTAPTAKYAGESPKWVPILMLALFVVGGLLIMARYLFWDSQIPMVVGMACLLGGLYTATKWR